MSPATYSVHIVRILAFTSIGAARRSASVKLRLRLLWPRPALKESADIIGYEAGALCVDVSAPHGPLPMRVEFLRDHDVQLIFRAGHRDVKQPPFFFDFVRGADAQVRWDATIHRIEHEHGSPLLTLGRVDRRQDQVVFIEQWWTGLVAGRVRRIERQFGQKTLACGVGRSNLYELRKIGLSLECVFVFALQVRRIPPASVVDFRWPTGAAEMQGRHRLTKVLPMLCGGSRWLEAFESCDCVATCRYRIQQLGGGTGAYSGKELRDAKARYPIARIIGPPQRGQNILDVRSFEEFETAELHEGNVFSCQLHFQSRAVMRGAKQHSLRLQLECWPRD
jgi:hypothetical protein